MSRYIITIIGSARGQDLDENAIRYRGRGVATTFHGDEMRCSGIVDRVDDLATLKGTILEVVADSGTAIMNILDQHTGTLVKKLSASVGYKVEVGAL